MEAELNLLTIIDHLALGGAEMMLGRFAAVAPDAGIRMSVTCLNVRDRNPAAEPLRALGIEPVTLSIDRLRVAEYREVRRHIAASRPDIVHTHLGSSDVLGTLAASSLGIPAVCTIHAMRWEATDPRERVKSALTTGARRRAKRIIAVSESARREYLAKGWAPADRVVMIRNGLDLTPATGAGARVRAEFGLESGDLVVGMVSALRPEKAHDIAIAAVARLRAEFPRIRLLITGQGESRHDIARLAAPHGDMVILTGMRTDVMAVLDAVDVCLHPSHADALPTTLIEAMAASVPVVATDAGGIPEIICDGETGVLTSAPPDVEAITRALSRVLADAGLRRALGAGGRQRYEREFRAGPWVRRIRALYDEVLDETRAPASARGGFTRARRRTTRAGG